MNYPVAFRFVRIFFVSLCVGLFLASSSSASTVAFQLVGTADLTLDGAFHNGEDFRITFSVDDAEVDQFSDPSRGAFGNVTTSITLSDAGLAVQDVLALNINGIRQDESPLSLYLANDSNFFNQGFSAILPSGTLLDVNQINPLVNDNVSARSTGAGLAWQLEGGQTLRFNQVTSITLSNLTVPEPNAILQLLVGLAGLACFRKTRLA